MNGRGLAAADYDNNGTVDIAVNSVGGKLVLLRNSGEKGHWLEVKLSTFAPGAVATAVLPDGRTLVAEEHAGSSYLSSEDPRLHFGLGSATTVRSLVVRFPGGRQTRLSNVRADRVVVVHPPSVRPAAPKPATSYLRSNCTSLATPTRSVARIWNDALLADDPGNDDPAEQARDLFHLSAATWDAWDAYAPTGTGYFLTEKHRAADVMAARNAAISYAAYRLLLWRASYDSNMAQAFAHLTDTMSLLCYAPDFTSTRGDSPAALGNRIAAAVIAYGKTDGSLESRHYLDPSYVPVNEPMVVSQPGTPMHDGTFWQPLAFSQIAIQGGFPIPADVQIVRGLAVGPRPRLRAVTVEEGPTRGSGPTRPRRSEWRRVQARRHRRHPRDRETLGRRRHDALARRAGRPGALERDRRRGCGLDGARVGCTRTPRVRRDALLRIERRSPRRGRRDVGREADVRLRASDLDDPFARLRRSVERSEGAVVQSRRPAARPRPRRARHEAIERPGPAPRSARRPRRRRRRPDGERAGCSAPAGRHAAEQ